MIPKKQYKESKMPYKKNNNLQQEEQIAVSILQGKTIPYCSKCYGLEKHQCITIVNTYCSKTNRPLYDTLRRNPFEIGAPITELRKHADGFIKENFKDRGNTLTLQSSIWDLPDVQTLTLTALWERNIETVADLLKYDERTLLRLPKLGKIGLQQLKNLLEKYGFFLANKE